MNHDRKLSLMTTQEIQRDLDMIRLAYRNRECEPLNSYRSHHVIGLAVLCMAVGCIIASIAAILFL